MAKYKVWLTVKDSFGNTKEIDGGTIDVNLSALSPEEIDHIEEALPLEDYIKRENLDIELDAYATDREVEHAVDNTDSIKYSDFELQGNDTKGGK